MAVVLALVAAAIGSLFSPLTDVDRILVTGAEGTGAEGARVEELVAASGVEIGEQLLTVDLADVRDRLRALPGLSSATVTREWPATIRIRVLEERPAVVVDTGAVAAVVSSTGRVLSLGPSSADADDGAGTDPASPDAALLPRLELDDVASDELAVGDDLPDRVLVAATVFERMSSGARAELPLARLDAGGSLTLPLGDGNVIFGPVEDVPEKLAAVESLLTQVVRDCMSTMDVREPARPTVARVDGCSLPAPVDAGAVDDDGTGTTTPGTAGASAQGGDGA